MWNLNLELPDHQNILEINLKEIPVKVSIIVVFRGVIAPQNYITIFA